MPTNYPNDISPKRSREDATAYRIFFAFAAAVLTIFALLMVYRAYLPAETYSDVRGIIYYFIFIGTGLFAAGLVLFFVAMRKHTLRNIGAALSVIGLITAFSSWSMYTYGPDAVKLLCVIYPVIAVYYLVYSIYQTDFFYNAVITGVSIFGLYLLSKLYGNTRTPIGLIVNIGIIIVPVLGALGVLQAQKSKGRIMGKPVFSHKTVYSLLLANCALMIVFALLALIFGAILAYYCIYAAVAFLFIMAVYYTVKLM